MSVQCVTEWTDASCCPEDIEAAFVWQSEWVLGRTYAVNHAVERGGTTFVCTVSHTASAANAPDVSDEGGVWEDFWNIMAKGGDAIVWQGMWVDGVYAAFDAVEHNGSAYIATVGAVLGDEPGIDDPPWDLMVQSGQDVGFPYAMETTANATPNIIPPAAGTIETNDGSLNANTGVWVADFDSNTTPQNRSDALEKWVTDNADNHGTLLLKTQDGDILAEWVYTDVTSAATGYVGFTVSVNTLNITPIADGKPVHIAVLQRGNAGSDGSGAGGSVGSGDGTNTAAIHDGDNLGVIEIRSLNGVAGAVSVLADSPGAGDVALDVKANGITYAKMQDAAGADIFLGNAGVAGELEELNGDAATVILTAVGNTDPVATLSDLSGFGSGDMLISVYDPAGHTTQLAADSVVNDWTAGQIKTMSPMALWASNWDMADGLDHRVTAQVTSGLDLVVPVDAAAHLPVDEDSQEGTIFCNFAALSGAGFNAVWEFPGGPAGEPNLVDGGDFTFYYRVQRVGTLYKYMITSLGPWS